jgi:hypothetical protein
LASEAPQMGKNSWRLEQKMGAKDDTTKQTHKSNFVMQHLICALI